MHNLNLENKYIDFINKFISEQLKDVEIYIFGSRAQNTATEYSDVDIALKAKDVIDLNVILNLKSIFQDSIFPYKVDIIDLKNIDEKFFNIIKNDLIKIN